MHPALLPLVHYGFAALFLALVLGFKALDSTGMIYLILKLAAYIYGPLLGLFAFAMFTLRAVSGRALVAVCVAAPLLGVAVAEWVVDMGRPAARGTKECGKLAVTRECKEFVMNTVEALEAQAEKLSPADRSRLMEHLVALLDADAEVEAEWQAVADARQGELDAGKVQPVAYEDAIARLDARFPG